MKIQLISDLHLEFYRDRWNDHPVFIEHQWANADVIVVAGDFAVGPYSVLAGLRKLREVYKHVVYVPGNHEYYGYRMYEFDGMLKNLEDEGIYFLNPGHIKIEDTTFIGACLWTNFRNDHFAKLAAKDIISDFYHIKDFSTSGAVGLYTAHLDYIKRIYEITPGKKVIVTHFLPAIEAIDPQYMRNPDSSLNKYFANDLGNWIADMTDTTWMFGHTHSSVDKMLGDTRILANPYGYYPEAVNKNFKVDFVV